MTNSENTSKSEKKPQPKEEKGVSPFVLALVALVVVVGVFFLFSSLSGGNDDGKNYASYRGFEFTKMSDFWVTHVQKDDVLAEVPFYYHPLDLEEEAFAYDPDVVEYLLTKPHQQFVVAIHPDAGSVPVLGGVNIARITGKFYGIPTSSALYVEANDTTDYNITIDAPIVSCMNATQAVPIFWIKTGEDVKSIRFSEENPHCIIIAGPTPTDEQKDILMVSDYFVYKLLRIMI